MSTPTEQSEHLERVAAKLDDVVMRFAEDRFTDGPREFFLRDLVAYCVEVAGGAPDSASRILRNLRAKGRLDYDVLSRKDSRYRITLVGEEVVEVDAYAAFVAGKLASQPPTGLADVPGLHPTLFPHQRDLVTWALQRGRAAVFADCGLGKTRVELEWARVVAEQTGRRVLILTPLAVAGQMVREAEQMGIAAQYVREPAEVAAAVVITNYERLSKFDASDFSGVVLDESSILKAFDGKTRTQLITTFAATPFRLAATATPAPNDHVELGNHAEFLGIKPRHEMLAEFFVNDASKTQDWRLKGHAVGPFWAWVASWAMAVRKPSDLGHDDARYELPGLVIHEHIVPTDIRDAHAMGALFVQPVRGLDEQRKARRATLDRRVASVVALIGANPWTTKSESEGASTTPRTTSADTQTTQRTELESAPREGARRKKTARTCASTTPETSTAGSALPSSKKGACPSSEAGTPPTPSSESSGRPLLASTDASTPSERSSRISEPSDSPSPTTSESSTTRAAGAPSADVPSLPTTHGERSAADGDFTSTTATEPASSEGCSAPLATSESASSATTPTSSRAPRPTSDQWIVWAELNDEQDALEAALGDDCVSIYGSLEHDEKIRRFHRWERGEVRVLVSKPSIFGFGVNMQQCARVAFVGVTHSFEQFFQAVRRCHRFGQLREVHVHVVCSDLEAEVLASLRRKERDAGAMLESMVVAMRGLQGARVNGAAPDAANYVPPAIAPPTWLSRRAS